MALDLAFFEKKLDNLRIERDRINEDIALVHKEIKQLQPQPRNMKNVLFPIVRDVNFFGIKNKNNPVVDGVDVNTIFGNEKFFTFDTNDGVDIYSLLVCAGAFESKGQARKNWQGVKEIPTGYSEIGPIGKGKLFLFIWNPTE